ncbi:MAG: DUF1911 domain-containing protein [Flavobacterium sp.]|nr:MAG: DUF1911 domain-containing protein [Flavobacterium sp.]
MYNNNLIEDEALLHIVLERRPKYILINQEDIQYFNNGLASGASRDDRIPAVRRQIFTTMLHTVIAKYSLGLPISELQEDFPAVIAACKEGWQNEFQDIHFDNYVLILWMLSLGILLHVKTEEFEKIVSIIDSSSRSDQFLDLLIRQKLPQRNIAEYVLYPVQFSFLSEFILTRDVHKLKQRLEKKWYSSMKLTYWYDNHKNKLDVFFGYWSFESAAFVSILNLDDSHLVDQKYYPYDLAHLKF